MSGKKGRKHDVPTNFGDKCRNVHSMDTSEVKLKPKAADKSTKTPVSTGIEDRRIKPQLFDKNLSAEPNPHNNVHKMEMQTLRLSKDLENMMMDTLRFLYGENFALKSKSEYLDQGTNLGRHYWIDQGGLVVLGGVDYSQKDRKKTFAELNSFAISKLEAYGFHKRHCVEALEATSGDLGASLELLMIKYFNLYIPLPLKDAPNPPPTPLDIIEQRKDELCSLESIFEKSFEVRIADRVWVLKLDLPYLSELYPNTKVRNSDHHSSDTRRRGGSKDARGKKNEICNAFAVGKICKFGQNCRFLHKKPEVKSAPEEPVDDSTFFLEIRFPPGCNYPLDVPVVCFSASADHFPPAVCLRLTSRLMKEAKELSSQEIPSVYQLASLLQHQPEEVLDFLQTIGNAFLSPSVSLFEASEEEAQNGVTVDGVENRDDMYDSKDLNKRQRKTSINIDERIREDEKLIRKFSDKQLTERYTDCLKDRSKLPAWDKMEEILDTVSRYQVVVISGETGCGKSTQVPQYLLDDWMLHFQLHGKKRCEIVCTQPRRISAIGVAERVADERLDTIGNTVGYQIRLESKMSASTRLLFCTTGILLRRLEREPDLRSVTHIIVDEVHERSEESDFLLMILKELLPKRPDLRVILMSATLDAKLFSDYFNKIPVINIPGRTFPVQEMFLDEVLEVTNYVIEENCQYTRKLPKEKRKMDDTSYDDDSLDVQLALADVNSSQTKPKDNVRDEMLPLAQLQQRYSDCSAKTIKTLFLMDPEKINYDLIETVLTWIVQGDHNHPRKGSVLIFLPGIAEIMTLHKQLLNHPLFGPRSDRFLLVPLHSTLTSEEQALVFRKCKEGVRKIILSTNIAETSITIDDCVFVIDSGRMKEKRFDSNKNMESLEVQWVTRANAAQRRGRAGRVMPGVCVHLYSKYRHDFNFLDQPIPEIHRVPLDQLILRIKVLPNFEDMTVHEVLFGVIEPPDANNIDTAIERLQNVGALGTEQDLTPLGHHLALLPVDVRIGKLMLYGAMFCCVDSVLTIAACLNYKSPFVAPFAKRDDAQAKKKEFAIANSDHLTVLKAYTSWRKANSVSRRAGDVFAEENYLSRRTLVTIADIKHQFLEFLADIGFVPVELRRRKSGIDNVMDLTGTALNEHGENQKLLAALIYAALYPNLVKILTPAKTFAPSILGAIPRQLKPEELKCQTMHDGLVFIHPSSITHTVSNFTSPYLVFTEKVKTSRVFIRDCSMVPMLPLVVFTGKPIKVELHRGTFVLALEEGWIMFSVESHQLAELLQIMREELKKLLEDKIRDPLLNLQQSPRGKKIISTIVAIISQG